jgi:hypothetical protein
LGGVPSSGADIITQHWTRIETYIDKYVGNYVQGQNVHQLRDEGEMGSMPFDRTLRDWKKIQRSQENRF